MSFGVARCRNGETPGNRFAERFPEGFEEVAHTGFEPVLPP